MAGYIGTKAALLSTTAANVVGDADIGGNLTVDTDATVSGDLTVDTSTLYVDSTNNRVGVGTTSPASSLDVSGTVTADGLTVEGSDFVLANFERTAVGGGTAVQLTNGDNNAWQIVVGGDESYVLRYMPNGGSVTERMRIDSSGNLLVGKTNSGTATYGVEARPSGVPLVVTNTTNNACFFNRQNTDGAVVNLAKAGSVVGSISVTGSATAYNTSSDYRLKEDWQPMTGASERVLALNPVNFAWKADGTRVDGFLAHEAQEVVPESVRGTKDGMRTEEYEVTPAVYDDEGNLVSEAVMGTREVPDYQGIDQSKLVPLLTAALQEALTEIADLKARVAALEAN